MICLADASGFEYLDQKEAQDPGRLETLSELAQTVSDIYAARFAIERDAVWHMAKLSEELGELQGAFLDLNGQGRSSESDLRQALEDEVADLMGQLLLFARWQDINIPMAMARKWGRYLPDG